MKMKFIYRETGKTKTFGNIGASSKESVRKTIKSDKKYILNALNIIYAMNLISKKLLR